MSVDPVVSVVIPVFRADPGLFRKAAESVLNQSLSELELIIVEDPSETSVRAVAESLRDDRVIYRSNQVRTSLARQHNSGLALARGEFIARFDADDLCHPSRFERQVAKLRTSEDIDVLGGAIRIIDDAGKVIGCRHYPLAHDQIVHALQFYSAIANPTLLFRRQVYERAGGWDEEWSLPAGDYEWFSRIARLGAKFENLDDILVDYRMHSGAMKQRRLRETLRATIEVKRRYWPQPFYTRAGLMRMSESLLLRLPPRLVMNLFRTFRIRSCHKET